MIAALALGLWGITRQHSMWRDEAVTYQVAHRSTAQIWQLLRHVDVVHGCYYLLMRAVFAGWDGGLTALRLPSVLGYVAATGLVAVIARVVSGHRAGVLCGLSYAVLPFAQKYAQEGRSYALVSAAVAAATLALVLALRTPTSRRRHWVCYVGFLALAGVLNVLALFVLTAHLVAVLAAPVSRRTRRRFLRSAALAVLPVVPVLVMSSAQAGAQLGWLARPSPWDWLLFAIIASSMGVVTALGLFAPTAGRLDVRWLAIALYVLPTGVLMLISEFARPLFVDRYVGYAYLGVALVVGCVLDRLLTVLARRSTVVVAAGVTVGCVLAGVVLVPWSLLVRSPASRKDDVVGIAHAIRAVMHPGDCIVFAPRARREWIMWSPRLTAGLDDVALAGSGADSGTLEGVEFDAATTARRLRACPRVILLEDPPGSHPPRPRKPSDFEDLQKVELLHRDFDMVGLTSVYGARVFVYAHR